MNSLIPSKELRVALVPLARPTFDTPLAQAIFKEAQQSLAVSGIVVNGPQALVQDAEAVEEAAMALRADPPDCLVILQATFADSSMAVKLAAATAAPLLLWAIPETPSGERLRLNSFCGVNLAAHALRLRDRFYASVVAAVGEAAVLEKINLLARAGQLAHQLRHCRVGVAGEHPAGMDSCHLDEQTLQDVLGVTVQRFDLAPIFAQMKAVPAAETADTHAWLALRLPNLHDLPAAPLHGTLSAYSVLAQIMAAEKLDGLAVRCWPEFFEQMGCAACGALSLLNDQLQPAACEADVNGTITQLLLQWTSGSPAFGADVVARHAAADGVVIWHCGKAPLSMADPTVSPTGGRHSNRGVPLVMDFALKPGPVTAARLSRTGGDGRLRLVLGEAEMVAAPNSFAGTSGVLRFPRPAAQIMQLILDEGLEHHVAITYGRHTAVLRVLADFLQIPVLMLA
jgi:L-fucose isomerase-like protein